MSTFNIKGNYIFIHVPRTGGTSMESLTGLSGHHKIMFYKQFVHHLSTGIEWNHIFKFGFVRNPYDRFVSSYSHLGLKKKNFKSFVKDYSKWWVSKDRNVQVLFDQQWNFLCNWSGTSQMDFIGKFENIEHDWGYICKVLGVKHDLPHVNASKRGEWKDYFDKETLEIVTRKYLTDFENWYPEYIELVG